MKIAVASDHRGFKLKNCLVDYLTEKKHKVNDFGTYSKEPCDFPDYVYPAAMAVKNKRVERAILICYTGVGSSILANRISQIRAALVFNISMAVLSRKHNNSNVLVLPAGFLKTEYCKKIVSRWLSTDFEAGRHQRRLRKIQLIEEKGNV